MSTFIEDNTEYEAWLRTRCDVVEADLEHKHDRMRKDAFTFLRATFFRWAKCIEGLCPDLQGAPPVASVGDVHVENFGTWRDAQGRWVWGINDFDEVASIAYPYDLVRLATSVRLSPIDVGHRDAAESILKGYRDGLAHPKPMLLDQDVSAVRSHVACSDKDCRKFWKEVEGYPDATPPAAVVQSLIASLPQDASDPRFATRRKGGGGLGRPRFVAIASWRGGYVVREAKASVPSAWDWAHGRWPRSRLLELAKAPYRSNDPFLDVVDGFILRRIAPDSRKADFGDVVDPDGVDRAFLRAMGADIGAIHAGDAGAVDKIKADLQGRADEWVHEAAKTAAEAVKADYAAWKAH